VGPRKNAIKAVRHFRRKNTEIPDSLPHPTFATIKRTPDQSNAHMLQKTTQYFS